MPYKYKLTYFNLNAVGEPIRWLFKVAKVEFEDERIDSAAWPALKTSGRFPSGTVPLLEIDGKVYTQSGAVIKYLAKRYGFITGNDILNLRLDQVHDTVQDGITEFRAWVRASIHKNEEQQKQTREHLISVAFPLILGQLEDIVGASEGPFIVGKKVTYADFVLANSFQIFNDIIDDSLRQKYPALAKHHDAVVNIPEIKAWIAQRPKVWF